MKISKFQLRPEDEFIELIKLLQIEGIAQTGGHAKIIVENGEVTLNGETESRKRKKLYAGDKIRIGDSIIEIAKN